MKNVALFLVVLLAAVPATATITWEAHYNSGTNSADYAAGGTVTPWSGPQSTTPWVSNGYTGGAVAPNPATPTNLNYPLDGTNVNVNLVAGTFSIRLKPNFDSTTSTSSGTALCVGGGYSEDRRRFLNLYYSSISDSWLVFLGRLADSPNPTYVYLQSSPQTFSAGDWLQVGFSWENSTGNLALYVDGQQQDTDNVGANYWSTASGGYTPWALTVGNPKNAGSAPYGPAFDGLIDDVVFSDVYQDTAIFSRTPEPATLTLLMTGLGFAVIRRRK
ncbi:MAG: PEP-CTERM sorting domain-containing protein [Phycisphaerae bacterium]|nr:PEP-CTERM sorting domain-containing protein [Phycisphaerae bacterium]